MSFRNDSPNSCGYAKYRAAPIAANSFEFTDNIGGIANPILVPFDSWPVSYVLIIMYLYSSVIIRHDNALLGCGNALINIHHLIVRHLCFGHLNNAKL